MKRWIAATAMTVASAGIGAGACEAYHSYADGIATKKLAAIEQCHNDPTPDFKRVDSLLYCAGVRMDEIDGPVIIGAQPQVNWDKMETDLENSISSNSGENRIMNDAGWATVAGLISLAGTAGCNILRDNKKLSKVRSKNKSDISLMLSKYQ